MSHVVFIYLFIHLIVQTTLVYFNYRVMITFGHLFRKFCNSLITETVLDL